MSKLEVVYVIYIRATQEQVWEGLTAPSFTRQYWIHDNLSDWNVGSKWEHKRTTGKNVVDIVGKVLESDHPRRLVLSWAIPNNADDPTKVSKVAFTIEKEDWPGGPWVQLRIEHTDLDQEMFDGVESGWPGVASGLKTLLESGLSETLS